MLGGAGKHVTRLFWIIAGLDHRLDFHAVFRPLFNLVEIAIVRAIRIVCLLVGPVVIHAATSLYRRQATVTSVTHIVRWADCLISKTE